MQGCTNPTASMKILPALLLRCLVVVLFCSLSACSSQVKQAGFKSGETRSAVSAPADGSPEALLNHAVEYGGWVAQIEAQLKGWQDWYRNVLTVQQGQ